MYGSHSGLLALSWGTRMIEKLPKEKSMGPLSTSSAKSTEILCETLALLPGGGPAGGVGTSGGVTGTTLPEIDSTELGFGLGGLAFTGTAGGTVDDDDAMAKLRSDQKKTMTQK